VLEAAVTLFAEHGVNGTSLQMIADHLGVSKASVYYQFQSKEDIVLEVVRPMYADVERVVAIAEAMPSESLKQEVALTGLIEHAVRHRTAIAIFYGDPAIDKLIHSREELARVQARLTAVIFPEQDDVDNKVTTAMITAGIYGATMDKLVHDVSDEDLQRVLLAGVRRLAGLMEG